jgi:hypothetical protein
MACHDLQQPYKLAVARPYWRPGVGSGVAGPPRRGPVSIQSALALLPAAEPRRRGYWSGSPYATLALSGGLWLASVPAKAPSYRSDPPGSEWGTAHGEPVERKTLSRAWYSSRQSGHILR